MRSFWIVFMLAGSLGLASGAAADNDSDILRRIGMLGEWAVDCGLPPGPTNQHYVFGPTESGEVISLSRNGRREFGHLPEHKGHLRHASGLEEFGQ